MRRCKKCGNVWIVGPKYDKNEECLRYVCVCGYSWTEPTKDTPKHPVRRTLTDGKGNLTSKPSPNPKPPIADLGTSSDSVKWPKLPRFTVSPRVRK